MTETLTKSRLSLLADETIQQTRIVKRELTTEEKKARNKLYYLKFIEKCRNHEFLTNEEKKQTDRTTISPEDKKEALAIRRRLLTNRRRLIHREAWNTYMRTRMKDKYRNDETYRAKQLENAKRRRALKKAAANEQNLATLQQTTIDV